MATVSYQYDMDPRYGWVHVDATGHKSLQFVIMHEGKHYSFDFSNGNMSPRCCCAAWDASECCCETGQWDE